MAHLYYVDEVRSAQIGAPFTVTGTEAHHAVRVARLRVGEHIRVGDGAGTLITGTVTEVSNNEFMIQVEALDEVAAPQPRLWLVQALAKTDRAERAIEQATEFGVHGIIPWSAHRSIVKWDRQKAEKNHARWTKIVREASKQSLRHHIPEVLQLHTTAQLRAWLDAPHTRTVVLDPLSEQRLSATWDTFADAHDVAICVGPEGGITDEEFAQFTGHGAQRCVLGTQVMRTSSAGPAALAVLNTIAQRW